MPWIYKCLHLRIMKTVVLKLLMSKIKKFFLQFSLNFLKYQNSYAFKLNLNTNEFNCTQ